MKGHWTPEIFKTWKKKNCSKLGLFLGLKFFQIIPDLVWSRKREVFSFIPITYSILQLKKHLISQERIDISCINKTFNTSSYAKNVILGRKNIFSHSFNKISMYCCWTTPTTQENSCFFHSSILSSREDFKNLQSPVCLGG